MVNWQLRPALAGDLEPLVELRAVVLRPDLERLGRYDEHRVRQILRDRFDPSYTRIIEVDGALVGSVSLRPAAEGHVWLENFYLAGHLQGGGIGSAVLRGLLADCDRDGVEVRLIVLSGSPAQPLYERHGFTVDHEGPVDVLMVRGTRKGGLSSSPP